MLRALLALLALVLPGPAHVAIDAPAVSEGPDGVREVVLDASHLPAPTGWFLVPVTVAEAAVVDVEAWLTLDARSPGRAAAVVVGSPARGASWTVAALAPSDGDVGAGVKGARVCCGDAAPASLAGGAILLREGRESRMRAAGETLWVGLAATEWGGGSRLSIHVTSHGVGVLRVGDARAGTTVERVDLAAEARRAGTFARAADVGGGGLAENVTRAWTPDGTALLLLDASARGDASAVLHARLPEGVLLAGEVVRDKRVEVSALRRGPVEVALHDLRDAPTRLGPAGARQDATALALYADLDVPLDGLAVRTS